jgi:hypothetical protein
MSVVLTLRRFNCNFNDILSEFNCLDKDLQQVLKLFEFSMAADVDLLKIKNPALVIYQKIKQFVTTFLT